jgi:hypothetical protein
MLYAALCKMKTICVIEAINSSTRRYPSCWPTGQSNREGQIDANRDEQSARLDLPGRPLWRTIVVGPPRNGCQKRPPESTIDRQEDRALDE